MSPSKPSAIANAVIIGLITANAAVLAGVATYGVTLGACLGIGVGVIILNYLTVWYATGVVKRDGDEAVDGHTVAVHPDYLASGACSAGCQFVAKAPANT